MRGVGVGVGAEAGAATAAGHRPVAGLRHRHRYEPGHAAAWSVAILC